MLFEKIGGKKKGGFFNKKVHIKKLEGCIVLKKDTHLTALVHVYIVRVSNTNNTVRIRIWVDMTNQDQRWNNEG